LIPKPDKDILKEGRENYISISTMTINARFFQILQQIDFNNLSSYPSGEYPRTSSWFNIKT
jgi:hypothetical protein